MAEFPRRRSIRLKHYDYSTAGAYFVTICVQDNLSLFGDVSGNGILLNSAGLMIVQEWLKQSEQISDLELDEFVVMPDHFHGILCLLTETGQTKPKKCRANTRFAPTVRRMGLWEG